MGYANFLAAAYREKDAAGADEYQDSISICIQFLGKLAQTVSHGIAYGTSLSQCKEDVKADTGKQFEPACKQSKMKTILQPK